MAEETIIVRLGPSPLAAAAICLFGGGTLALVAATALEVIVQATLALAVGAAMLFHHRRHSRRQGAEVVLSFLLAADGAIDVETRSGWTHGLVRDGSFVAPFLTVIRWRPERARFDRRILVLPDMLPASTFRALRVLLRWS